jgi:hypothetical protein
VSRVADPAGSVEAGVAAGLAGLAAFLVLHHVLIVPIWFVAPAATVLAAVGGAAVGSAYRELLPRLPRRPWTALALIALTAAVLGPAVVLAEIRGAIVTGGPMSEASLLVSPAHAAAWFALGLFGVATLMGVTLGRLVGRTRRASALTGVAGFCLALGPGHNIPLLGGTSAASTEVVILLVVAMVSSFVLVRVQAALAARRRQVPASN